MRPDAPPAAGRGFTVADVAARYRVGADKIRLWVRRGELAAVNVAGRLCGRTQLRVMPEALAAFEAARDAAPPPRPPRRRRPAQQVDYFPDM
jgi:hypothetical protein